MEVNGAAASGSSVHERIKNQLATNDPALTKLTVGSTPENQLENDSEEGWERDGSRIGSHGHLSHLKVLIVDGLPFHSTRSFNNFFGGVSRNRSIESLQLVLSNEFALPFFETMASFFEDNPRLEYLEVRQRHSGISPFPWSQLASTLQEFDSLRQFVLEGSSIYDEDAEKVILGLQGHRNLTTIILHGAGTKSLSSLGKILRNSKSELKVLSLYDISIDDETAFDFSSGLRANKSLKDLLLDFGDTYDNRPVNITNWGWKEILNSLPNDRLGTLDLFCNNNANFNDSALHTLSNVLTESECLKSLNVSDSYNITDAGWRSFFRVLERPSCKLECLEFSGNNLHGNLGVHLADALRGNSTLRELNLMCCELSDGGLRTLSSLLRRGRAGLEKLDLRGNLIGDATMRDFANSLLTNQTLRCLRLSDHQGEMERVWEPFSRMLCNRRSIGDTHSRSNHRLQSLSGKGEELTIPDDVSRYLWINENNTRSGAARRKIIDVHFSGAKADLGCFVNMEAGVLPHAVAWMGRCSEAADLSLMLQYVPNLHSYFDASGKVGREGDKEPEAKRRKV